MKKFVIFSLVFIAIFSADRITKNIVDKKLPLYGKIVVIPGFFNIHKIYNNGLVFGFLSGNKSKKVRILLNVLSISALILFLFLYFRWERTMLLDLFFVFILSGALSNIYDKLVYGYVIDFLDFYIKDYHWPFFNIADSFITIGLLGFVFYETLWRENVSNTR